MNKLQINDLYSLTSKFMVQVQCQWMKPFFFFLTSEIKYYVQEYCPSKTKEKEIFSYEKKIGEFTLSRYTVCKKS